MSSPEIASVPSFEAYAGTAPENYERYFVPAIGRPLADALADLAGIRPGQRVLDLACGTGIVASVAAERVGADGSVAGVDINPGMLAVARSTPASGAPISWHEATADALPFPDGAFDLVLCQLGLQFFPEPDELRGLMADAGFRRFDARAYSRTLRLPPPEEFLWQYLSSTPLATAAAELDDRARTAVARDVVASWQPLTQQGRLILELGFSVAWGER